MVKSKPMHTGILKQPLKCMLYGKLFLFFFYCSLNLIYHFTVLSLSILSLV